MRCPESSGAVLRRTWLVLALVLAVGCATPQEVARDQMAELQRLALTDVRVGRDASARKRLLAAARVGKDAGLQKDQAMVRIQMSLGALYSQVFKDERRAMAYLYQALDTDPEARLPVALAGDRSRRALAVARTSIKHNSEVKAAQAARAQARRDALARQEAARQEVVARQEAARQEEAARREAARQAVLARQQAARQEVADRRAAELARQEALKQARAARQEALRQEQIARQEAARAKQQAARQAALARQEAARREVLEREEEAREIAAAQAEAARQVRAARAARRGGRPLPPPEEIGQSPAEPEPAPPPEPRYAGQGARGRQFASLPQGAGAAEPNLPPPAAEPPGPRRPLQGAELFGEVPGRRVASAAPPPPPAEEPPPPPAEGPPPPAAPVETVALPPPTFPAGQNEPIYCPVPLEAPPSHEVVLRCAVRPDLQRDRLTLHYRPAGSETFTAVSMSRGRNGVFQGVVPVEATAGKSLQFFVESRGPNKFSAGSGDSPNVLLLRAGAIPVGEALPEDAAAGAAGADAAEVAERIRREDEDPLAAGDLKREAALVRRRPGGKLWVAMGVGSGYGLQPGQQLEFRKNLRVNPGALAAGLGHALPEIGYQISDRLSLSVQGRFQYAPVDGSGDPLPGTPKQTAMAVLARAVVNFGEGPFHSFASICAGGMKDGGFRLVVPADLESARPRSDTVRGGPFLAGAGGGVVYHFNRRVAWPIEARALIGFPTAAAVFELGTGVALSF